MMPFALLLLTLVGFISSAQSLQCKSCDSTVGWEDCQSKIILEDCGLITPKHSNHVHQCFQLEEKHAATNSVIYRQGCTGDPMFCAERSQVTMEQCSLCTDDNASSECTSMVHRVKKTQDGKLVDVVDTIHFQRTQGDAKALTPGEPGAANSSIEIDIASRDNGTDQANTVNVELKNKQTTEKNETQIPLSKQVESTSTTVEPVTSTSASRITTPRSACNRNPKKFAVSAEEEQDLRTVEPEETKTSTSSTIGPQGPIVATGPPEASSSKAFGLANEAAQTWLGLLVIASLLVLGV